MKTRNVRSRQWRRHYRKIKALDSRAFGEHFHYFSSLGEPDPSRFPVSIIISDGILRHSNKMAINRKAFWIP